MTDRNGKERERLRQKRADPVYLALERVRQVVRMRARRAGIKASRPRKRTMESSLTIRIEPDLLHRVKVAADRDSRTVGNFIRRAIEQHLDRTTAS